MSIVAVRFRDCACPGTPHDAKDGRDDGDIAFLPDRAPLEVGLAAEFDYHDILRDHVGQVVTDDTERQLTRRLWIRWTRTFVTQGVTGWNLVDADGQPVPLDTELLAADYGLAKPIADKAHELGYADGVMRPLTARSSASSRNGRTGGSTSADPAPTPPSRGSRSGRGSAGRRSAVRTR